MNWIINHKLLKSIILSSHPIKYHLVLWPHNLSSLHSTTRTSQPLNPSILHPVLLHRRPLMIKLAWREGIWCMLHVIGLHRLRVSWRVNCSVVLVWYVAALLGALVWGVTGLVAGNVVVVDWELLEVAGWWGHEYLGWVVWVGAGLGLCGWIRHLAQVVPALDCHLFLRPQNLLQGILLFQPFCLFTCVLLNGRMLRWCRVFWLNVTRWNSFLLVWGWRISLRNVLCRNITWIACFCVSNDICVVVKTLSGRGLFWYVLRHRSLDFLVFGGNNFFILILMTVNVLFLNILIRMLCPSNTSLNALSHLLGRLNWNSIWWLWYFLFIRVKLPDSFINKFSILFEVELCVVADWRVNHFVRNDFFFWFVEWGQVRMFENLSCCWSFLRVDGKH